MPWVKGQSGNPTGGSKVGAIIRALARQDSEEAYLTVTDLMRNGDKDSTRLAAALAVLKVAGVPMSADVNITVTESPQSHDVSHLAVEDLEAGLRPEMN
jgi:hypothetical protein